MLQPIVDQFPAYEERRADLEAKIAEVFSSSFASTLIWL